MEVPPTWDRVPAHPHLGWGTPIHTWDGVPPNKCGLIDACENLTSRHPSDAGGKNGIAMNLVKHVSERPDAQLKAMDYCVKLSHRKIELILNIDFNDDFIC